MTDLEFLSDLALEAGRAILAVYDTDFSVEEKEDRSPLTLADLRSHRIIRRGLQSRFPDIPMVSEEGEAIPYDDRKGWSRFWLVDPLDGTKEFIKKNGEFTVNIALIEEDLPVWGVVYIPVSGLLYAADNRQGCWEVTGGTRRALKIREAGPEGPVRVVRSRSHPSPGLVDLLGVLPPHAALSRGSSLKFCSLASGEADFYPRMGPTWEWDTAAGHAVVAAAGGVVVDFQGLPLRYNKPDLLNGPFLAGPSLSWLESTGILRKARSLPSSWSAS